MTEVKKLDIPDVRSALYHAWEINGNDPALIGPLFNDWLEEVSSTPRNLTKQTQVYLGEVEGNEPGDCQRTAIACLLEIHLAKVPHFLKEYRELSAEDYWQKIVDFVEVTRPGYTIKSLEADYPIYESINECPPLVIQVGKSPRGDFNHAVLADSITGKMYWDPHPTRDGILDRQEVYAVTEKI